MRARVGGCASTRRKAEDATCGECDRRLATWAGVQALADFNCRLQDACLSTRTGRNEKEVKIDNARKGLKHCSVPGYFAPVPRGVADNSNLDSRRQCASNLNGLCGCLWTVWSVWGDTEVGFAKAAPWWSLRAVSDAWYVYTPSVGHWSLDDWREVIWRKRS